MRCKACDKRLGNRESTRKALFSGEYVDLCDGCLSTIEEDCPTSDSPYFGGLEEGDALDASEDQETQGR